MSVQSQSKTLDQVCEFIVDCLHKTAPIQDQGYPLIRSPNIGKGRLILDGVYRISEDTYETWTQRAIPQPNDLILAREAPAGNIALVKEGEQVALGQRTVHLRPDAAQVDPAFLCYFLLAPKQQGLLLAGETGVTAKHINMKDIRRLALDNLPPLPVQKRYSDILSAYDDLIENNHKRMVLLLESTKHLYREWFVQLRFPGHEHVKTDNGVPSGWKRLSVKECCQKVSYGYTASSSDEPIGPKFLRITDIVPSYINWDSVPYCEIDDQEKARFKIDEGDIVVARTGATVGYAKRIPKIDHDVVYASYLVKFKPDKEIVDDRFLGVFMESDGYKEFVRANAGGAAQPNANAQILGAAKLLVPTKNLQERFCAYYGDIVLQKQVLEKNNALLARARDMLLPRLMAGELAA